MNAIVVTVVVSSWALTQATATADRAAQVEQIEREYEASERKFYETIPDKERTAAESIRLYEAQPLWQYLPRFVAIVEAQPDDDAAFRCCRWIIDHTGSVGTDDKRMFVADQVAWNTIAAHHAHRPELPMLCFEASQYTAPAREQFLRGLLKHKDLSRENKGFATVALAEYLANQLETIEYREKLPPASKQDEVQNHLQKQCSPDWVRDLDPVKTAHVKAESIQLFRDAVDRYADVPVTITAPRFRSLKNLGEKASKSLHALEHLTPGSEAPNIMGKDLRGEPLDLQAYRGRVVVLSFWFTGCGPCMGFIPQEKRLIETYKGRPFALLGVCNDADIDAARKTAEEHQMDWPCWFDGENGPLVRDWNVLGWPGIFVLDKEGRIVAKDLRGEELDAQIAELMKDQ